MATTTTTKRKKKLVYRQDPDGVFRLKKENDNESIHSQTTIEKGKTVDRLLNELMECSYKVLEPEPPMALKTTKLKPKIKQAPKIVTKDLEPVREPTPSPTQVIPSPPTTTSSSAVSRRSSSKSSSPSSVGDSVATTPVEVLSEPEPACAPEPQTAQVSQDLKTKHDSKIKSQQNSNQSILKSIMASTKNTAAYISRFHIPSYLLGIISTVIAVRYLDLIINLVIIGVILGGVGIVVSIGVVGLLWYFENLGILKGYNNTADKLFNKLETFDSPRKQSKVDNKPVGEHVFDNSDILPAAPLPQQHHQHQEEEVVEDDEEDTLSDGQVDPIPEPKEEKKSRRSSQIRVAPYRYERRQSDYPTGRSAPNLLSMGNGLQTFRTSNSPPSIKRVNTEPLKLHSKKSGGNSPVRKTLPILPMQAEELPFINEVRLVDSYSDLDSNNAKHKHHDDGSVKRSNSTMSKQSLLRTRENYKRFMANAEDGD
ncbi:hypothetical protein JA1_004837 [Spathaspora sp. JA1]|nr:hypothetical protein JA1_004837 [Spathaspora sp. JA1]